MSQSNLSRRDFLKMVALGAAGAGLTAAGMRTAVAATAMPGAAPQRAQTAEVVLQIAGWPYVPLPETEPENGYDAYQQALQAWLADNPNVRLESVEVGIWDTGALTTAIAGGVAPAYYHIGVIGGWTVAGDQAAFAQGLVADITDQYQAFDIDSQLSDAALSGTVWYKSGDRYFGLIQEIAPGNGILFRKDIIAEAGLEAPTVESNWEDIRQLAAALTTPDGRKGLATQFWGMGAWWMGSEGIGESNLFSLVPAPDTGWNWRWDFTTLAANFDDAISRFRAMMYEDQSVLIDGTFGDGQVLDQFVNGNAVMATVPLQFYPRTDETSPLAMAERMGANLPDIVGAIPHPRGVNGHYNNSSKPVIPPIGLSPDLNEDQKTAAVNLYMYMELGGGYEMRRRIEFDTTGDLKRVFTPYPSPRRNPSIEGIEGTPADAWGQDFVDTLAYMAEVSGAYPERGAYLPAEQNPGPATTAWGDATSRLTFEAGDLPIGDLLREAEETINSQAQGFISSIPDDQFVAGARAYYQAHVDYWSSTFPEFYEATFRPWYDSVIVPALGL